MKKAGVDVNAVDNFGHTALINAVKYNSETDAIERLVALGADVNIKTKASLTALNFASSNRDADAVRRLLELGADPNVRNNRGYTPLIYASKFESEAPVFNLLLEHGADVNVRANDGKTALMKAVEFNNAYAVHMLLQKGADPTPVDEDGISALDYGLRYAKRVKAEEQTAVCKMLNAGLSSWTQQTTLSLPEPKVGIRFSECSLKYNPMNGKTKISLSDVRLSREASITKEMFQKSFGLTKFLIENLQINDTDSEPLSISVIAQATNFMSNSSVQQLFGNILDVDASVELDMSFPQMKMSVRLKKPGSMHVIDSNALRVLQGKDQNHILVEFDISQDPIEAVIGWEKFKPSKDQKPDLEFLKAVQQFQEDADVIRLEHILYWSELIEKYYQQKGCYPLQDQLKETDFAILVKIATKTQRQFISPGSEHYKPDLDMNGDGRFKEYPVADFVSELENVFGHEVKERYDIQKAPTQSPVGYYYFSTPDGYLIWCICPTFGVSKISTLLMDGFTPTVNIVSEGMKGKVTKALLREELIAHPIFKEWRQRKLSPDKEEYIRKLIRENENNSKTNNSGVKESL